VVIGMGTGSFGRTSAHGTEGTHGALASRAARIHDAAATFRTPLAAFDAFVWVGALIWATWLRYDFGFTTSSTVGVVVLLAAAALAQVAVGTAAGLYTGRWTRGSFEETYSVALTIGIVGVGVTVLDLALGRPLPVTATLASGAFAFLGIAGLRWVRRIRAERKAICSEIDGATRVIVFGAGSGGASIIETMRKDPDHTFNPVAILDDDPDKSRLRLSGIEVCGGREQLEDVAREYDADMLVIAIPSASPQLITEMSERAEAIGLTSRVLPTVSELIDRAINVTDIRPVSYVELLGRREVEVDLDSIAEYLTGRRVLITGAGGSIGSELCRQVHRYAPASLVMLDRDESALHGVVLSIESKALLDSRDIVVADIRDRDRLEAVFAEHQPEVVFHAAALKHLPLLEMYPDEAIKSNVWGTLNLLEAASAHGVDRFVNISTDKAADPTSVLGYSKRVAERLTRWFAAGSRTKFMSVRFGNVLGSRGSVLTTFQAQIAAGGPVTVTHPEVTRYFMTVEEAVRLVIQAGAFGSDGDALVLDMGEPVRIADVARQLIEDSGRRCEISYTGLRAGEKIDEVLVAEGEVDLRPVHPLISHVHVPALNPADALRLPVTPDTVAVAAALRDAADAAITLPTRSLVSVRNSAGAESDRAVASVGAQNGTDAAASPGAS
jgi:FlaA1/EpsC-like NDP-sugar epimerase